MLHGSSRFIEQGKTGNNDNIFRKKQVQLRVLRAQGDYFLFVTVTGIRHKNASSHHRTRSRTQLGIHFPSCCLCSRGTEWQLFGFGLRASHSNGDTCDRTIRRDTNLSSRFTIRVAPLTRRYFVNQMERVFI